MSNAPINNTFSSATSPSQESSKAVEKYQSISTISLSAFPTVNFGLLDAGI